MGLQLFINGGKVQNKQKSKSLALRIALGYLFVGSLYILFSDQIVSEMLVKSEAAESITVIQTIKGWLFIIVTATILYYLIHRHFLAMHRSQEDVQLQKDRYLSLFQNAPVPIWLVDFSNIRSAFFEQNSSGISASEIEWITKPDSLRKIISQSHVTDVNLATLELFEASSREQLDQEIAAMLTDESCVVVANILARIEYRRSPQRLGNADLFTFG